MLHDLMNIGSISLVHLIELIDAQLSRLSAERLQSDVRFAASYARQRIGRGYGPLRLREELRARVCLPVAERPSSAGALRYDVLPERLRSVI